jgi:hypothetical protein
VKHILRQEQLRQGTPDGLYKLKIDGTVFVTVIQVS